MDPRVQMDREVHLGAEDHPASLDCLVLRVRREQLVLMVQLVPLVHRGLMDPLETEEFRDCQDRQALLAPEDLLDPKEREEMLVLLERKDPLDPLDLRDLLDPSEPEVNEERKDLLARLVLLAWEGDLVTKDLPAQPDLLDLLAPLDFLDLLENLVKTKL
jgi:hypothetical protein